MKNVAVHSGSFHGDDVFAVAILRLIYPEIKIIRTREPEEYNKAEIRVDVGKKYNPKTHDFDHHQPEDIGQRNNIPYAAAGLVWKHFGVLLTESNEAWEHIDKKIMQPIDARDNGQDYFESTLGTPYVIQDVIDIFNPSWQDSFPNFDEAFEDMVQLATKILKREIYEANGMKKAEEIVKKALEESSEDYIILEKYCPWEETVIKESDIKYVIYPSTTEQWGAKAVPVEVDSFENRKSFPKEWEGLEFEELEKVTGVKGAVFCHKNLFIVFADSKEAIIELVKKALKS